MRPVLNGLPCAGTWSACGAPPWVTFLKALGLDIGDVSKAQQQSLDDAKQELNGLRKTA
jgi:hypothetical protein